MSDVTYIYALHDPCDWSIRYIGKANDPQKRLAQHQRNPSFTLLRMSILSVCKVTEWQIWERFWITVVRASGIDLLNVTEGGNGMSNPFPFSSKHRANLSTSAKHRKHSQETRAKLSVARRRRIISTETKEKVSATLKNRRLSLEHRMKIGAANKGKKLGPQPAEVRAKKSAAQKRRWQQIKKLKASDLAQGVN